MGVAPVCDINRDCRGFDLPVCEEDGPARELDGGAKLDRMFPPAGF